MRSMGLKRKGAVLSALFIFGQAAVAYAEGIAADGAGAVAAVGDASSSAGSIPAVLIVGMALFLGAGLAFLKHQRRK